MKNTNVFERALLTLLLLGFAGGAANAQAQKQSPAKHGSSFVSGKDAVPVKLDTIPVTTKSAEARQDYQTGMLEYEDLLLVDEGVNHLREAVKADPHFALGHAMLAFATFDPVEAHKHRVLAKQYMAGASPDERLQIRWLNGTKDGQIVPAIAAMNDLLAKYPNDKQFADTVGAWLCTGEQAYDRGADILERVLQRDPEYAPAMNNLAYCYALGGRAQLSPPWLEKYVVALPDQPNPQDSYAEISRMMGNFPAALEHYNTALKMSPSFTASQVGLATTYALMGEQERARGEYVKAMGMTKDDATIMNYGLLSAMTYFREGKIEEGRKAYKDIAADAHKKEFAVQEAEAHRSMALFNPDVKGAFRDLDAARAVLAQAHVLSAGDHDTELATILQTRAYIAARSVNLEEAKAALAPLSTMARTSRSNIAQQAYHSANGAVLLLQGIYAEAVSELQYDSRNPLSLQLLSEAETKAGEPGAGHEFLVKLAGINDERIETAYVVPQARASLKPASLPNPQPAAAQPAAPAQPAAALSSTAAVPPRASGLRGGPLD
jgi:tetratricopeptide (TPR) repeat protein